MDPSGAEREAARRQVERWIEAARNGSDSALGEALEACRDYLLLIANSELAADLKAKGGASDLVQETFLDARQGFEKFRGQSEAELLGWLRQILLNKAAGFARKHRKVTSKTRPLELRPDTEDSLGQQDLPIPADTKTPGGQVAGRESAERLRRALERLPQRYRQVIELRNWQVQSFAETGRQMGCTEGAARKLWARAIKRLEKELGQSGD